MTDLMSQSFILAEADDADVADIVALDAAAVASLPTPAEGGPRDDPITDDGVRRLFSKGTVYVARAGQVLLAYVCLTRFFGFEAQFTPTTNAYQILNFAVAPKFQGRDIGTQFLLEVEQRASGLGAGAIRLDTHDGPGGAADFYYKCGYREVDRSSGKVFFEKFL